jgi:flagellar hook-length control protein FliK
MVRQLLWRQGKFADHRVAQVAALLASVAKTSAPSSSAQPSFGDDFAAVLAGLTSKTDAKDAPTLAHLPQTAHPVEQAKPVAAKAKPGLPAAVTPVAADIKPEPKLKASTAKAEPASAAPAKAAPESDDAQDIVAAIAAPQPIDSAKIAPAVKAFLASDASKASAAVDDDGALPQPIESPKVASDTPKAAAPAVAGEPQPAQVHDAKPVTPEALAEIVAVAKSASAPSNDTVKLKADAALKLPANASVKVTSVPPSEVPKAQPRPDGAPRAQSDIANAPQDPSKDSAGSHGGDAQQDASPQRHDAPQADQAPAVAKAAPLPGTPSQAAVAIAQPATSIAATAAPAAAAAQAAAPQPDQPSRLADLGTAIAVKAAGGAKSFEIRLDPAELGRVEVQLNVAHDGTADATITVHRPETLALLLHDSQNLERTLRDAGLDVSNSSLNFSLKGEGRQGDGGGASGALKRNLPDSVVARSEATNASIASPSLASPNARLDIRV